MDNEIDIPMPVDFSLFNRSGGFITFSAPSDIVEKSSNEGVIPDAGSELKMILSSKEENSEGLITIKIMLAKR